jgi:HEAT repeat protein
VLAAMTHFCPACWRTVQAGATSCPYCRSNLAALDQRPLAVKLIAALRHPEPATRQRAAHLLGELRDPAAVTPLGELLFTTSEPFLAAEIVTTLGKIEDTEVEGLVIRALQHRASVVRLAALRALVRQGEPTAALALRQVAHDPSPSVRRFAREMEKERRQC